MPYRLATPHARRGFYIARARALRKTHRWGKSVEAFMDIALGAHELEIGGHHFADEL